MSSKNTFFCLFAYCRTNLFAWIDIIVITLICVWIKYKIRQLTIFHKVYVILTIKKHVTIPWIHPVTISAVLTESCLLLSADVYTFFEAWLKYVVCWAVKDSFLVIFALDV